VKADNKIIIFAVILGLISFFAPGFLFCAALVWVFFALARRRTLPVDKDFVTGILAFSLAFRGAALILIQYLCFMTGRVDILGDSQDNVLLGVEIGKRLIDPSLEMIHSFSQIWSGIAYNAHAKSFFNAAFFAYFGPDVLSLKFTNCIAVVVSGWLVYDLARRLHSGLAGRIALCIFLFWPTLFVWSLTDLKESQLVFAITSLIWLAVRIISAPSRRKSFVFLGLSLLISFYFVFLKLKLALVLILVQAIIGFYWFIRFLYSKNRSVARRVLAYTLLAVLVLLTAKWGHVITCYDSIMGYQRGFYSSGGINYYLLGSPGENIHTVPFFLRYLTGAWVHFLGEPFPGRSESISLVVFQPLMLIWYFILIYMINGMITVVKSDKKWVSFALFAWFIIYVTVVSMSIANIGTAVRFRDAMLPVIAVFAGCGVAGRKKPCLYECDG